MEMPKVQCIFFENRTTELPTTAARVVVKTFGAL